VCEISCLNKKKKKRKEMVGFTLKKEIKIQDGSQDDWQSLLLPKAL